MHPKKCLVYTQIVWNNVLGAVDLFALLFYLFHTYTCNRVMDMHVGSKSEYIPIIAATREMSTTGRTQNLSHGLWIHKHTFRRESVSITCSEQQGIQRQLN